MEFFIIGIRLYYINRVVIPNYDRLRDLVLKETYNTFYSTYLKIPKWEENLNKCIIGSVWKMDITIFQKVKV